MNTVCMTGGLLAPSFWENIFGSGAQPASILLFCAVAAVIVAAVVLLILLLIPFRLTLHTGNGKVLEVRCFWGRKVELYAPSQRKGYLFAGWYQDEACTIPVKKVFRMPLRGAVLYAKWTRVEEASAVRMPAAVSPVAEVPEAVCAECEAVRETSVPRAAEDSAAVSVSEETGEILTEDAEDSLDDTAEGDEIEGAVVTPVTGGKVFVQYRRSYTARLIQADDATKELFNGFRNEVLSYIGVKERVSWNYLSFNVGRRQFAKLNANAKSLIVYFALDPAEVDEKINFRNVSEKKRYAAVPVQYKMTGSRSFRYAIGLLEQTAAKFGLDFRRTENTVEIPYEEREPLIRRGLIKVYAKRDTGESVTAQQLEEMIAEGAKVEKLSDFVVTDSVSVNDAESLIDDATAQQLIALAEVKESRLAAGKRTYINLDTISAHYAEGEVVDLASLKERGLIDKRAAACKVLARGTLDKSLTVEAADFSLAAVKMIALTGGKVVRLRKQ